MGNTSVPAGDSAWEALKAASAEDKARWQELWVEEYRSVRSESEQARSAQQTILQWSLGSFAAVIAGGLVMLQGSGKNGLQLSGEVGFVLLLIFGLGLPGLAFFAYLVWWGEFLRMERAGRYARGLELVAARLANGRGGRKLPPPLQWEHFLAGHTHRATIDRNRRSKHLVGYVGTTGLYFGFFFSSLVIFISLMVGHNYRFGPWIWWMHGLAIFWCAACVCIFVITSWRFKMAADHQSLQGIQLAGALPTIEYINLGEEEHTPASSTESGSPTAVEIQHNEEQGPAPIPEPLPSPPQQPLRDEGETAA